MIQQKPCCLPKVRALPAGLEVRPLRLVVLFGEASVTEFIFLIVGIDKVLNDSTRFPQRDVCVGVMNGCMEA
jgi:hypothetical protein